MVDLLADYHDEYAAAVSASKYSGISGGYTHGGPPPNSRIDFVLYSVGADGDPALTLKSLKTIDTSNATTHLSPSDHQPVLAVFTVKP